ncbi:LpxL/LpxP family acyltransferase [Sulfurirhabdus autotrophica]|uniref:Putative LPLAT superfamily acyltransferase n=1 Tax=Sulfurirhabdus autotrophica TaxID=1706046 RepID=A0A4R3Y7H2_9PROT|nr:acyl-CoA synthetase [Sulfurirhabdus autotrophica]TCV87471.1 putative LPLAT superfamily acyltransferase [Sulfurirhabdus autotrophica]
MRQPADDIIEEHSAPEWVTRPERSNALAIRFIVWVALKMGRSAARLLLYPICLYFMIFSGDARKASRNYLQKALGRKPGLRDLFRHVHAFASTILDRVFLFNNQFDLFDVRVHGQEVMDDMIASKQGCFLLGAHMGSFEIIRSLGRESIAPSVSMVMYEENAKKLNAVLNAINPDLVMQVIALGKIDSMFKVEDALARGGFVGMLADRTIEGEGTVPCDFFGEQANLSTGPFRIAMMLKQPIVLMFGLYQGGNQYDIYFERFADISQVERSQRTFALEQALKQYTGRLEHYCRLFPYNWFNFYDFWK